jgi:hypothetical protein
MQKMYAAMAFFVEHPLQRLFQTLGLISVKSLNRS